MSEIYAPMLLCAVIYIRDVVEVAAIARGGGSLCAEDALEYFLHVRWY